MSHVSLRFDRTEHFRDMMDASSDVIDGMIAWCGEVGDNLGFTSVWSLFDVTDFNDKHLWPGAKTLTYSHHWGETEVIIQIEGDTWLDLWKAANKAIRQSRDDHHIFIESFTETGHGNLELGTGS